jgi:hypothetical protein
LWLLSGFGTYVIFRLPPQAGGMIYEIIGFVILVTAFIVPFFLRRFTLATVLIYWILFTLIPPQILSFVHPVSDRYMFLPSVAVAILMAWLLISIAENYGKRMLYPVYIIMLILGIFWARNTLSYLSEWTDPRSVWFAAKEKSADPLVFYNQGWHYMDIAARFGTNLRKKALSEKEAKQFANAFWKNDSRLSNLFSEWSAGQKGGVAEKSFQKDLQLQAWNDYEQAVSKKGKQILPDLYFHRGLLQLDMDNLPGARNEFLNGINEANRISFEETKQNVLANCYTNLGIVSWREGNYRDALKWMKLAEEGQIRYGKIWLPDVTSHRKKLEEIIASLPGNQ